MADVLSRAGHHEEALDPARRAVEYYAPRVVAEDADDAMQDDLASAWNAEAVALHALGRDEEAAESAANAARIFRSLLTDSPEAIAPDLIDALQTYADTLDGIGQGKQALAARSEAEQLKAMLGESGPDDAACSAV